MAADSLNERSPLRRRFPILRFFEISALSLSPPSVLIACLALLLLDLAEWSFFTEWSFTRPYETTAQLLVMRREAQPAPDIMTSASQELASDIPRLVAPWNTLINSAVESISSDFALIVRFQHFVFACVALTIWSLAGLILCRRAIFLFAENDQYSFVKALRYSITRWSTTLLAPAIPLFAALAIGLMLLIYGFVGRIPYIGAAWLIGLSPLAVIAGLMIAIFVIATALGWPLMIAAIASDDCDGFGGLSRAYSGITGRPWIFVGYVALSLFVGSVLTVLVAVVGNAAIACTLSFTAFGAGIPHTELTLRTPATQIVLLIERGIGVSFFWTAATVIYLFLRHEIDGLPLDHVASADDPAPVRDPLPVVGIPATDSVLRSATPTDAEPPVETQSV